MVLNNKLKRVVRLNRITLVPGANTLDEAQTEALRAVADQVKERVTRGAFELMDMDMDEFTSGEAGAANVTEMNTRNAVEVIRETVDVKTLEKFQEQEEEGAERKGVLSAIEKQLDKVEAAVKREDD